MLRSQTSSASFASALRAVGTVRLPPMGSNATQQIEVRRSAICLTRDSSQEAEVQLEEAKLRRRAEEICSRLERFPCHWVLPKLLNVWHNACDVEDCPFVGADLHQMGSTSRHHDPSLLINELRRHQHLRCPSFLPRTRGLRGLMRRKAQSQRKLAQRRPGRCADELKSFMMVDAIGLKRA